MFHSQCLVTKKGPLGAIWVAAYFFKKLKKAQVKETDITSSVDEILQKELEALAYRVLGYLLLGVVRIYSKKVDYLFDDCNKILINVKDFVTKEIKNRAGKPNMLLPVPTPCFGIVLPERFELDAFDLEILEDFHGGNIKPQEDITLKDGGWHCEGMDQHSMERFDAGEYSKSKVAFHETCAPAADSIECDGSARDVDKDAENARSSRSEDAIRDILRMIEEDTVNPEESRDNLDAARGIDTAENVSSAREEHVIKESVFLVENRCDMEMDVENARSAQEEDATIETTCLVEEETQNPNGTSGDDLNAVRNVDTDAENIRSAQQGDTDREMPSMVGNEALNLSVSFGVCVNSNEQKEYSDSDEMLEEVSREKMRHDRFHSDNLSPEMIYGIERQLSGDSLINGEKEINAPGEVEATSEICLVMENPRVENRQYHSDGERTDSEVAKSNQMDSGSGGGVLHGTPFKDLDSQVGAENTLGLVTPEAPPQLSIPKTLGASSPHFLIIPTPAAKEGPRVSGKRKCVIDDTVVIPNKLMKKSIEDSSELVTKRRKVPHTARVAWRISRLINPSQFFLDPLIPCRTLELQSLSVQPSKLRKLEIMETPKAARTSCRRKDSSPETMITPTASTGQVGIAQETAETPRSAAPSEVDVAATVLDMEEMRNAQETVQISPLGALPELQVTAPETMENCTETALETAASPTAAGTAEQTEIAPETPVRESTTIRFFKSPESPNDKGTRLANSYTSFDEEAAMFCEDRDLDMILMQDEVSVHEKGNLQLESLSARTRKVAKFLEKIFESRREREDDETVSLFQLCKGRTRKESARLFYETLVLKTKDYLEVKQDYPYSDILLRQVTRRERAC